MGELKQEEVKQVVQSHTVSNWLSWNLNTGSLVPRLTTYITVYHFHRHQSFCLSLKCSPPPMGILNSQFLFFF